MDIRHPFRRLSGSNPATRQAAEWLMILEDKGADANAAFSDWLRESPTHIQAYLRAATLDVMLKHVDPERSIEIARPAPGSVTPDIGPEADGNLFEPQFSGGAKRNAWRLAASLAAVGVLAAAWAILDPAGSRGKIYQTDVGEQRSIKLQDGSTVMLNTNSRLRVRFSGSERQLSLLSGEANFRVQRDSSRPFRVRSGNSVVQAIGTEFNMYRMGHQTTVSVIEGRVAVMPMNAPAAIDPSAPSLTGNPGARTESVVLNAGEQLRLGERGPLQAKSKANVAKVAAWRQRRLVFIDEPLSSIGYELNRYNRSPKIKVEGPAAQQRRYAVILDADDPDSLVAVLSGDSRVTVERRAGEIIVRER